MKISADRFSGYSPVGDILVTAVCIVLLILMLFSYIKRNRAFKIFAAILCTLVLAAYTDIGYQTMMIGYKPSLTVPLIIMRLGMHFSIFTMLLLFVVYITEITGLGRMASLWAIFLAGLITGTVVVVDIVDAIISKVRFDQSGNLYSSFNIFLFAYIAYMLLLSALLYFVRNRVYRRVFLGFVGTAVMAVVLNLTQQLVGQTSFMVGSFMLPVIAMFYIVHSNPYDIRLGAIDSSALYDQVRYYYEKRRSFYFMSLLLPTIEENRSVLPASMQATIRHFATAFFRDAIMFKMSPGHLILLIEKRKNRNFKERCDKILKAFDMEYRRFRYDYKIVIGEGNPKLIEQNEYLDFIRNIHQHMDVNAIHYVEDQDGVDFERRAFILRELSDICHHRNLNDPRVLVYCQPVYNIQLGRYDTAEALMRLDLPEIGMVYPDQFIPLAEENGYIHVLTEIILHKTCEAVRELTDAGYSFKRISVNVSPQELKDPYFCRDVTRIIQASDIPGDRVAIELTESQDESDFLVMQEKIGELKGLGIKFYLDDFGTGYSSLERIMQLPFDIIKFDRSLVIASAGSEKSAQIVRNMARLFAEMNFSVLYEGVEDDSDERRCIDMSASYLQGYKYSRPVPIQEMTHFFSSCA